MDTSDHAELYRLFNSLHRMALLTKGQQRELAIDRMESIVENTKRILGCDDERV